MLEDGLFVVSKDRLSRATTIARSLATSEAEAVHGYSNRSLCWKDELFRAAAVAFVASEDCSNRLSE